MANPLEDYRFRLNDGTRRVTHLEFLSVPDLFLDGDYNTNNGLIQEWFYELTRGLAAGDTPIRFTGFGLSGLNSSGTITVSAGTLMFHNFLIKELNNFTVSGRTAGQTQYLKLNISYRRKTILDDPSQQDPIFIKQVINAQELSRPNVFDFDVSYTIESNTTEDIPPFFLDSANSGFEISAKVIVATLNSNNTFEFAKDLNSGVASVADITTLGVDIQSQLDDLEIFVDTDHLTISTNTVTSNPTIGVASGGITATELASNSVTTIKIANDAITNAKIATNAVNADSIAASAVGTSEIADDAVTFSKIQNIAAGTLLGRDTGGTGIIEAITLSSSFDFSGNQIDIANGAIGAAELATDSVTSAKVADNAIFTGAIQDDAVTYAKIQNVSANVLLGRTGSSGAIEELTLDSSLVFSGNTLSVSNSGITSDQIASNSIGEEEIVDAIVNGGSDAAATFVGGGGVNTTGDIISRGSGNIVDVGRTGSNQGRIQLVPGAAANPAIYFSEQNDAYWSMGIDDADNSFKINGSTVSQPAHATASVFFEFDMSGGFRMQDNNVILSTRQFVGSGGVNTTGAISTTSDMNLRDLGSTLNFATNSSLEGGLIGEESGAGTGFGVRTLALRWDSTRTQTSSFISMFADSIKIATPSDSASDVANSALTGFNSNIAFEMSTSSGNTYIKGTLDVGGQIESNGLDAGSGNIVTTGDVTADDIRFGPQTGMLNTGSITQTFAGGVFGPRNTTTNINFPEQISTIGPMTSVRHVIMGADVFYFSSNIGSTGDVAITPSDGTFGSVRASSFPTTSDERLKENIVSIDINKSIELIDKSNPVEYNLLEDDKLSYGFIAQEVEKIFPELVKVESNEVLDDEGNPVESDKIHDLRSLHYLMYIPHLVNYVKDLRAELDKANLEIQKLSA